MRIACPELGSACQAINDPEARARVESMAVIAVLLFVGAPNFSVSVLRCGFQWGMVSRTKWLANARGIAINGLGIAAAMAAPTKTWGVSSIRKCNHTRFSQKMPIR